MRTYDGNIVPDNEVVFHDGILYVMSRVRYIEGDEEKTIQKYRDYIFIYFGRRYA